MVIWQPPTRTQSLEIPESHDYFGSIQYLAGWAEIRQLPIGSEMPNIMQLPLVDIDEAGRFKTAKRAEEHATGRHLLAELMSRWAPPLSLTELIVERDERKAPYLKSTDVSAKTQPPRFTVSHSSKVATALLSPPDISVGIDIESLSTPRRKEILSVMSCGSELHLLEKMWANGPLGASPLITTAWVLKESIQKALRLGMGINPWLIDVSSLLKQVEQGGVLRGILNLEMEGRTVRVLSQTWEVELLGEPYQIALSRLLTIEGE